MSSNQLLRSDPATGYLSLALLNRITFFEFDQLRKMFPAVENKLGLFCSVRCPGDLILRAYGYAKKLRDDGVTVIGGFHSPVEKECLRILLRGTQPVIICPARSLGNMRIPSQWKKAIDEGRLLLLSAFTGAQKRATAELAQERNTFVAVVADKVCFIHTAPGGSLESLANDLRQQGKSIIALP